MKTSDKQEIIKYLESKDGFVAAGLIARAVHEMTLAKESQLERRMREMANEGTLEKCYSKLNGVRYVCYRLSHQNPVKRILEAPRPHSRPPQVLPKYAIESIGQMKMI